MILEIVVGLLAVLLFYALFTRRPVCQGGRNPGEMRPPIQVLLANPEMIKYEVKDLYVPKTSGRTLKFMAWLLFTRFGRLVLIPFSKRTNNLDLLGGVYLPEKPTLYPTPLTPPIEEDYSKPNQQLIHKLLDKLVGQDASERKEFHLPTVADYVRAFKSGVCTPTDVARAVLEAIADSDRANPPLRAIVDCNHEAVMAMAEASTERWKNGNTLSVLDGIPVAMKGQFRIEPYTLRAGSLFEPDIARKLPEAAIARKLKDAGAVLIGVANMQEFGAGVIGSNPHKLHLTARNPYNPNHYPGGSSSGSAVAVAAGLCPIAIGADGGGSVRIPATMCGIVGVKPTNFYVDLTGSLPISYSNSAPGPLCSSVLDTAIAMDVIVRETEGEKKCLSLEGLGESSLEGLSVGVYWEFFEHADKEIVQKCKRAVEQLKSLGATVVEIKIPELEDSRVALLTAIMPEVVSALNPDADKHFKKLNPETCIILAAGNSISAVEYINAQKQRTRAIESLKHIFGKVDVIVTPGTACSAPVISPDAIPMGESNAVATAQLIRYTFLANLTGIPGLVYPVGYTENGLPISLQVMGRWYEERTLLKIAWAMENSGAFPIQRPNIFYDIIEMASRQ